MRGSSFGKVLGGDPEADKEPDPEDSNLHMTKWVHVCLYKQEKSWVERARFFCCPGQVGVTWRYIFTILLVGIVVSESHL